jgi:hypothetical protein
MQTKLLAGKGNHPDFLAGECTDETVELAKANLARNFRFVGPTERFNEGLAALKLLFGWNIAQYASFNVTPTRLKKSSIPEAIQAAIAERNRYDVALYQHVVPIYEALISRLQPGVGEELKKIEAARELGWWDSTQYLAGSALRKAAIRLRSAL